MNTICKRTMIGMEVFICTTATTTTTTTTPTTNTTSTTTTKLATAEP